MDYNFVAENFEYVERVSDAACELGESPVWDDRTHLLYWVDIQRGRIYRWGNASDERYWDIGIRVGSLGLTTDTDWLVLALEDGFAFFDLANGMLERLPMPRAIAPNTRFNNGKCDQFGRFWAGTMSEESRLSSTGALYCLDVDLSIRSVISGVAVSNSLAWPSDGGLYFSDSPTKKILKFNTDARGWPIIPPANFAHVTTPQAVANGSCVDGESHLWNAEWNGSNITQYSAEGEIVRRIVLPVTRPTSCTFGGPHLNDLYITTARYGLSCEDLEEQTMAGHVLRIRDAGVGVPCNKFIYQTAMRRTPFGVGLPIY